jgi:hypothetical protein
MIIPLCVSNLQRIITVAEFYGYMDIGAMGIENKVIASLAVVL